MNETKFNPKKNQLIPGEAIINARQKLDDRKQILWNRVKEMDYLGAAKASIPFGIQQFKTAKIEATNPYVNRPNGSSQLREYDSRRELYQHISPEILGPVGDKLTVAAIAFTAPIATVLTMLHSREDIRNWKESLEE